MESCRLKEEKQQPTQRSKRDIANAKKRQATRIRRREVTEILTAQRRDKQLG